MTDHLHEVEQLLTRRIGLDPLSVGPASIARAVHRQMAEGQFEDVAAYHRRLLESENELGKLIDDIVVPESWFFRDERPFHWLENLVRKKWIADPSRPSLRVLSLACSGGEEPYSIAMILLDLGLPAARFRIDAIDVSARRLAIARRAVYGPNSFRGRVPVPKIGEKPDDARSQAQSPTRPKPASPERWRKYFHDHESGLELVPAVRSAVHFSRASVLDPLVLQGSPLYDIIFCRNLLIYFDAKSRAQALTAIEGRLSVDGYLVIGHADRLDPYDEEPRFTLDADAGSFVYRRAVPPITTARPAATSSPPIRPAVFVPSAQIPIPFPRAINAAAGDRKTPASQPQGNTQANLQSPLERAASLSNQGRFDAAIEECARQIHQKGPSASAYYLMGMIHQAKGDRKQAEACFQKTAYLEPTHAEALLALALLAERRGDLSMAAAYHRRAERAAHGAARTKGNSS